MATINKRFGATDGYIRVPGGSEIYIFGWVDLTGIPENEIFSYRGKAQLLGPLLEAKVGDEVYLTLTNLGMPVRPDLDDSHTIHWHGFPNQIPVWDGVPEASISVLVGRDFVYYYKPLAPGTYIYHCHFEPVEHIQMGMVGPLLVRPADYDPGNPAYKTAYGHGTGTEFDREYFIFLTELDTRAHQQIEAVQEYDWTDYKPDYWLNNGRSYPDTVEPSGALPYQPYSSLIRANSGDKVLLRFVNLGYQQHSIEILGVPLHVIGQDAQRPLGLNGENLSYRKNALYFAAGQTMDAIFTAPSAGTYPLFNRDYHKNVNAGTAPGGMVSEIQILAGSLPPQPGPGQ
ncbi:MAG: copper oxidase [Firmicutes bacterium HGW-Firmicutes-14]|nr:MAG: copper oxidase [Firmicutes bacterium HGW-Firmicutes-14]